MKNTIILILLLTTVSLAFQNYTDILPFNTFATSYNELINTISVNPRVRDEKVKVMLRNWRKLVKSQKWEETCND